MNKAIISLVVSLLFLGLALFLMARPVTSVTSYFAKHGHKTTGKVLSRSYRTETIKAENHTKKIKLYKLMVTYKGDAKKRKLSPALVKQMRKAGLGNVRSTFLSRSRTAFIRFFVTKSDYDKATRGSKVNLLYLKAKDRKKGMPSVILESSVGASFFSKFAFATRGDLTEVALGLIIGIFALLGIFLSVIMLVNKNNNPQPQQETAA